MKNKARTPVQKRGIETREKILKAAVKLFGKKGYHRTQAPEIAAGAGVATGTFYSYFNNKKEVLIELIRLFYRGVSEQVLQNYRVEIHERREDNYQEGRKLVHYMLHTLNSAHTLNPGLHREIIAMILLDSEIEKINRLEERKVVAHLTALLRGFSGQLRVTDIEAAAVLLYRTGEEIIHRIRIIGPEIEGERLLGELEDMICRYLLLPE